LGAWPAPPSWVMALRRTSWTARWPELLDREVTKIGDREIFAVRDLRAREGKIAYDVVDGEKCERQVRNKPSTINRDQRTSGRC
jgi:hypothetical protein